MATQTPELPASPVSGAAATGATSDPLAQTIALIQPWIDYVPRQQRRLGIFIFLALLAHLATFFFIRIDTTRSELRHQPHTHVTVENLQSASPEIKSTDNFWNQLTDPRLFVLPVTPILGLSSDEPALDFRSLNPSISSPQLPAPAQGGNYEFIHPVVTPLEEEVAASMVPPRQSFFYETASRPIAVNTTWQWDMPLARRKPVNVPNLPSPISDTDLVPTELRVAVNANGTVENALIEQSSGKLELDQQAVLAARKIRFHASDQPDLLWGRITIFWHYSAQPREEVVPTPLSTP